MRDMTAGNLHRHLEAHGLAVESVHLDLGPGWAPVDPSRTVRTGRVAVVLRDPAGDVDLEALLAGYAEPEPDPSLEAILEELLGSALTAQRKKELRQALQRKLGKPVEP